MSRILFFSGVTKKPIVSSYGSSKNFKILFVASEGLPYIKSGGLADVIGSLPQAIQKHGYQSDVVLPLYKKIKDKYKEFTIDLYTHNALDQETFDDIRNNQSKDKRRDNFER